MITPPLPLSLPSVEILRMHVLAEPRCVELTCRDAAGNVHILRCNFWTLDRLARAVWPRPVRIAFLAEAAARLNATEPVALPGHFHLPPMPFRRVETVDGLRYVPQLQAAFWPGLQKKFTS